MKQLFALLTIFASTLAAQCHSQVVEIKPVSESVATRPHLLFPTLPLGYSSVRQSMFVGGEKIGFITNISDKNQVSKVVARVFLNKGVDFSKREYRVAAFKGYVNGAVDNLKEAGYKVIRVETPSLPDSEIVSETAEFEFVNDKKDRLWFYKRVFFDSRGFDIMVVADNKDSFAELKAWSAKITASEIETQKASAEPIESPANELHANNVRIIDLQGEWKVEVIQIGEKQFPMAAGMPQRLLFNDNIFKIDAGEKNQDQFSKMKIELVGGHPMKVNLVRNRNGKEEVLPGILELTDKQLRVGLPLVPVRRKKGEKLERPKSFDDKAGPFMSITASRAK